MGKKRGDTELLPAWFRGFFGTGDIDGFIELRVFPNDRGKMVAREWVQSSEEFCDFVNAYNEKDDTVAIYFAPAIRSREGGTKQDVSHTTALWAEIDTDKLGWSYTEVARRLHDMPGILQPSCCIHSGHGLHLYWYVNEDLTEASGVEETNKLLRDTVAGDNVWDIARVMRVPYTWNTKKRPVQSRVLWHYPWFRHDPYELFDALDKFNSILTSDGFIPRPQWEKQEAARYAEQTDPDKVYGVAWDDRRKKTNARGLQIWKQCRYGGGPGHVGLDEAIMLYTAHEYCRLMDPTPKKIDWIVEQTMAHVREVKERDAPEERWDWRDEEREVRAKLMRWVQRWDGIKGARDGEKKGSKRRGAKEGQVRSSEI